MKELRIGLVLYGGVSLAVYMNGVSTELWNLLRASRQREEDAENAPGGLVELYRELLDDLAIREGGEDLRIVVDAIAGSSAGGLNGAVLAKAIVEGGDASVLSEIWLEQADVAALLIKPRKMPVSLRMAVGLASVWPLGGLRRLIKDKSPLDWPKLRDLVYELFASKGESSPLDGRYFTRMIAKAFERMATNDGPSLMPRGGTFDLSLTRSDLYGWPRHLPLDERFHPKPIFEATYAHVMTFRYRPLAATPAPKIGDDFDLTFASRSTAGFPGAFPPVNYDAVCEDYREARPADAVPSLDAFAERHMREHCLAGWDPKLAWMVDGGVLDNKPFTYVARAIEDKPADRQVYRSVIYVEPDPTVEIDRPPEHRPPLQEALGRVYALMRDESIYDDLRTLGHRNAKVERLTDIRNANAPLAEKSAEAAGKRYGLAWPPEPGQLKQWLDVTSAAVQASSTSGYSGYVVHRARCSAGIIADTVCRAFDYPYHSRHAYLVRTLIRDWLRHQGASDPPQPGPEGGYSLAPTQAELLQVFDIPYQTRRLRALVQKINAGYGKASHDEREGIDRCKDRLATIAFDFERTLHSAEEIHAPLRAALGHIDPDRIDNFIEDPKGALRKYSDEIGAAYVVLLERFAALAVKTEEGLAQAIAKLPDKVRRDAIEELAIFPFVDVTLFPLMDMSGVTDLIKVKTMRISPADCQKLFDDPKRLLGRKLGGFAGFFRRADREHDLLWGRLDALERLLKLVVAAAAPEKPPPDLEHRYFCRAARLILDEEENRDGSSLRSSGVGKAIREKLDVLEAGSRELAPDSAGSSKGIVIEALNT